MFVIIYMQGKPKSKQAERYKNLAAECGELLQQACILRTALYYSGNGNAGSEKLGNLENAALLLTTYKAVAELEYSILLQKDSPFPIPDLAESQALLARISDAVSFGKRSLEDISGSGYLK